MLAIEIKLKTISKELQCNHNERLENCKNKDIEKRNQKQELWNRCKEECIFHVTGILCKGWATIVVALLISSREKPV